MNTKEICRQLSITPKMLRIYESQKLINAERGENNYRNYTTDDVLRIQIIVTLRNLGFSLNEIKTILNLKKNKDDVVSSFYIQLKATEAKIEELGNVKRRLSDTINEIINIEDKGIEFSNALFSCEKNRETKSIAEEMITLWNFDNMAENYVNRYLKEDMGYLRAIKKVQNMLANMPLNKSFLDAGGGTCNLWSNLKSRYRLTVIDKSLQMILTAKEKVPWAKYVLGDITVDDMEKFGKFDIVVSTFTLHHITYEKHRKVIENLIDLCEIDGRVLLVDRSFKNQEDRLKKEESLVRGGNFDLLKIFRSEYYLLVDETVRYINFLGYQVNSYNLEPEIWVFEINKTDKTSVDIALGAGFKI